MRVDPVTAVGLAAIALLVAAPAYAYIDPGSGSLLVQLVTGGVAGAALLLRLYWRRLKENISNRLSLKSKAARIDAAKTDL